MVPEKKICDDKINIFIPAAGQGERLRPVTNHIPKPLIPVLGKPVMQYMLERVSELPYGKIGINTNYKKDLIESWVSQCFLKDRIALFPEENVLGTGGALKNAEGLLKSGTFLVHNSDILSDMDLQKLLEFHWSSNNLATLAVHDRPEFNCLEVDENGFLEKIIKWGIDRHQKLKAFTGIAVYKPEFLKLLPSGESGVVDTWLKALSGGYRIGTFDVTGCEWNDIGTPSAYASAVFKILRAEGETVFIHPSIKSCDDIDIQGNVVIEKGYKPGKGVTLKNCILLPAAGAIHELPLRDVHYENCLIGPDFKIDLDESAILRFDDEGRQLIGTGGSDRRYYRIRHEGGTVVLMQSGNDDPDLERQIEYSCFFRKHGLPVPELIEVDKEKMQAVFEDAGDMSLYSYLRCPRSQESIEYTYRKVIDIIAAFHTSATENVSECPLLQERTFDFTYFRWETDYFTERFLKKYKKMEPAGLTEAGRELDLLAEKAASFPKTVVHRDFQSQNIMVAEGCELKVIDYQGARMGPPAYDVASILWDPYYCIEEEMREKFLEYYIERVSKKLNGFSEVVFIESLCVCRLQRHMQALGAYGFLSSAKGKRHFLKYVPEGLRLLKEDISVCVDEYPALHGLIMGL